MAGVDNTTLILMVVAAWLILGAFGSYKLRKQIRCRYTSKSKQSYEKFVKSDSNTVIFEKKPFYILPSCVTHHWRNYAIIFSMFMPEVSYTWESQYPIDPNTGKVAIVDPNTKSLMRAQENMANYAGSQQQAVMNKGKMGGMDKWTPFILIGVAVAVGFAIYKIMGMETNDKITQQAIIDIYNPFNSLGQPIIPAK